MIRRLRQLLRDTGGSTAIEFAILGPVMIAFLLGVFQIGVGMQAYNALRSIALDTARYAAVQYQTSHTLDNTQISTWARARAINAPYLLNVSSVTATTVTATTQRVSGANERTLTLRYTVPTFLDVIGFKSFYITYQKSIFLPL